MCRETQQVAWKTFEFVRENSGSSKDFLCWAMGEGRIFLVWGRCLCGLPSLGKICVSFILKDQPTQSFCKHSFLIYRLPTVAFRLDGKFICLAPSPTVKNKRCTQLIGSLPRSVWAEKASSGGRPLRFISCLLLSRRVTLGWHNYSKTIFSIPSSYTAHPIFIHFPSHPEVPLLSNILGSSWAWFFVFLDSWGSVNIPVNLSMSCSL